MEINRVREIFEELVKRKKIRRAEELSPTDFWHIPAVKEDAELQFIFGEKFDCIECEEEETIEQDCMTARAGQYIAIIEVNPKIGSGEAIVIMEGEEGKRNVLSMGVPNWIIKIRWVDEEEFE